MIYVCSDIHGNLDAYLAVVSILSETDELYIIGDVLDRGTEGIKIVLDAMKRQNIHCLIGNHEYMLKEILTDICFASSRAEMNSIIAESLAIDKFGQEGTLRQYAALNQREKIKVLNFLEKLPFYKKLEVEGKRYLLVHGGLPDFSDIPLEYYSEEELLFGPHDYNIPHYKNTIVVIGHQPTRFISGAEPDAILRRGDTVNLDCGLGFGGRLGVLCLNTDEEIYI